MSNLVKGKTFSLRNGAPVTDLKFKGSNMTALSSNGEVNANDNRDLMHKIGQLLQSVSSGEIVQQNVGAFASLSNSDKVNLIAVANSDKDKWAALGASIAQEVREQQTRQGFLRSMTVVENMKQGEVMRVPMPKHGGRAIVATGPTALQYQLINDRYFTPSPFELKASVRVSKLEMVQATHDLLDHAYNEAVEGMVTAGDRIWKSAADRTVGKSNNLVGFSGALTPAVISRAASRIREWNLPVSRAVIAASFWEDIQSESSWATALTPVSQYELLLTGKIATIFGLDLMTDGFRPENQRVLTRNDAYIVADSEYHATMGSFGGIESTPTDGSNNGETTKGWLLSEVMSFVIPNTRSVIKLQRI
jgi:hypothetical protein